MKSDNKRTEFQSPEDYKEFSDYLTSKNRYVLNGRWLRFLSVLRRTAIKRTQRVPESFQLVRARIGSREEEYEDEEGLRINFGPLSPTDLGAPPKAKTKHGRANPRGIPYLYLSNKLETAVAEARPWIKADISIGFFQIKKNIKILNLSKDKPKMLYGDFNFVSGKKIERKYTQEQLEEYIWGDLNKAFSLPIQPSDENDHYIPTQFIAEFFKNRGYNGIFYKSSVDESGHNIVLFNPKHARQKGAKVFDVTNIKYEFKESGSPYSVPIRRGRKRKKTP